MLFCLIFLFYRYSNNKTNYNNYKIDDNDDDDSQSTTRNEKYNEKINYEKNTKEINNYPKVIGNKGFKQKFVNNKISDYFTNDNPTNNMLGDIQKYKELSNKYNLE